MRKVVVTSIQLQLTNKSYKEEPIGDTQDTRILEQ